MHTWKRGRAEMMRSEEFHTAHGVLQYMIKEQTAEIIGYRGKDAELSIPALLDGYPVTHIGKKAFLSNKILREIALPEAVVRIDDWAFAYCTKLSKITLPYHRMEIGQGIFKDCHSLEQIVDERADMRERKTTDIAYLLAATMSKLEAFYLFDFENAGTPDWIVQWDNRMLSLMDAADTDGYSKMLLCGEEDYGSKENNLDYYMEQRRRQKVRLAMLRLMHDFGLAKEEREKLETYLLAHIKGQATEETWKVVLEEHGDDLCYYQFLTDLGGACEENFQAMMEDMGESHTEMKAYLMKYHSEHSESADAFAMFEL